MKTKILLFLMALLILSSSCASRKRKENTISLSGAFALYPLVIKWSEEYKKINPEIRFNISAGGAGKGMADALSGTVDLGMFSREISEEEKSKGAWWVGLTIDAVLPTINAKNPYVDYLKTRGLTRDEFRDIFITGKFRNWDTLGSNEKEMNINVYTRSDACGAAETWAKYLGAGQENLLGIGIFGDPGIAEAISNDPLGIGYSNTNYVFDIKTGKTRPGLDILPIDINSNGTLDPDEDFYGSLYLLLKAISEGKYPSPPARELYFVSKGKPVKKAVLEFIQWTLTDGQKFIAEAGYVPLNSGALNRYLEQLE
jgi:phosphate transport system substrate-binding protein